MSQAHKKQHFVSQFILHRFAPQGKVCVYDKASDRVFPASPVDIGHENHFLTIPELDKDAGPGAFFEKHFQLAEGPAAAAVTDILARTQNGLLELVTDESREALTIFLALQHIRTRQARDRLSQLNDAMDRALVALREEGTDDFKAWIDEGLTRPRDPKRTHAEQVLNPTLITTLAETLHSHVWLLYSVPDSTPLYLSDHPLAMHTHARAEGRGYGPASFGTELEFPLSPRCLLCLMERRWIESNIPRIAGLDGKLVGTLRAENVEFQRSLQVAGARQFVYCSADDFDLAREMCEANPQLRDPDRPRVEMVFRGRSM